tara:strand:- start:596 stop:1312 length:717 start_codon:yes stop_codon:yes gene_type:complete
MGKISQYTNDTEVVGSDRWIGTDSQSNDSTKNFTAQKVANFLNNQNRIDNPDLHYKFQNKTALDSRDSGTISFDISLGASVPFSSVSTFMLSERLLGSSPDISSFYTNPLIGATVMISRGDDISTFGIFKWDSSVQNILEPTFYDIGLTYATGNGDLVANSNYIISILSYGATGDKNFVFTKTVASTNWVINHTLNKFPSVSVVDSAGTEVIDQIQYINLSQITITFSSAFSGEAFLN